MVLAASGPSSAAGATMKSASQSNSPVGSGPRGPAGPSNSQPRSSPAGNAGGAPGSTSRTSNGGLGQGGQWNSGYGGSYGGPGGPNGPNSSPSTGGGFKGSTTSSIGSAASSQRASAQSSGNMGYVGGPPNAAAARASAALNAGLGRPTAGALNTSQAIGVGGSVVRSPSGAALGSFGNRPDVAVRDYLGSGSPISLSGTTSDYYHSFRDTLPGMNNPNQFDKTIRPTNMVNAYHVPVDTWSNRYNANALTPGAQKIHQAIVDNALRTNTPVDFFSGRSPRASATAQHPMGQALDVRLRDPVTGAFVGTPQIGSLASNPIGNVRPSRGRTPEVAAEIQGALEQPYRQFATGVMNSFMSNPGVYGDFNNQRWGGSFGGTWAKDYMHYDEGKVNSAVNADQAALRREAANYTGPQAQQTASNNTMGTAAVRAAGPTSSGLLDSIQQTFAPKTDLFTKTNLEVSPPQTSVPSWYQGDYTGRPTNTATTVPSNRQSTYTGRPTTLPSNQQSTYTGPVAPVAPASTPIDGVMKDEAYSYPVKPYGKARQQSIDAAVGVLPVLGQINSGLGAVGYSAGNIFVDEENKLANMTPEQRERYRSYWSDKRANSPGRGDESRGSRYESTALQAYRNSSTAAKKPTSGNNGAGGAWEADAKTYGYSEAQLKDPETRGLIKQLWDMGFIPKSTPA